MPVFVSTEAQATTHGVFAIERNPPAVVQATGTGVACIVEQFPWGPEQVVTEPDSIVDLLNMVAPPGMDRTGPGYLAIIKKGWPRLKFIRVTNSSATAAAVTLDDTAVDCITLTAKYVGTAGNAIDATVSDATDGDSNHFNLAVTVTGASGTTTDTLENLNYSGVGSNSTPDLTGTLLLGSITLVNAGRPDNGTFSFASAVDGSVVGSDYVGTEGDADKGIALLEGDQDVDHIFYGDPGNSLRATVNEGFQAHADFMTDRVVYIAGDNDQDADEARTDAASYQSIRCVYVDPWVYMNDDVDGTRRFVPGCSFVASVAAQLPPSTSVAWKDAKVRAMLNGIVDLQASRGIAAGTNTAAGVLTIIRERLGGFSIEAGVVTEAPATPSKKDLTRTRMGIYIARSFTSSVRSLVDAPNVPFNQQDLIDALESFMSTLKNNATTDPNNLPHVVDYKVGNVRSFNTAAQIAAGDFTIPLDVQTSSSMARIFLSIAYGPTVTITAN